jgi:hypothetical protein
MDEMNDFGLGPLDVIEGGSMPGETTILIILVIGAFLWLGWLAWKSPD